VIEKLTSVERLSVGGGERDDGMVRERQLMPTVRL
jgi:hypothetical protein